MLKQDLQGAVVVSKLSQGSVEAYLLASGVDEEDIKGHPLMVFEVELQNAMLDLLEKDGSPLSTCDELKALALEEGISNIGLEINPE